MSRNYIVLNMLCAFAFSIITLFIYSNYIKEYKTTTHIGQKISLPDVNINEHTLRDPEREKTVKRTQKVMSVTIDEIMAGPLPQDDPRILEYIEKSKIIYPPSKEEYNLTKPNKDPSMGQTTVVKKIFKYKRNGFFVECGALDGETRSNTLRLEKKFNWTGILIEADPRNFKLLLTKRRKAWAVNACLATKSYPHQVLFTQGFSRGKIVKDAVAQTNTSVSSSRKPRLNPLVKIQCFPVFSLLAALKVRIVDYFSLDIEGNELQVLKTIPFDKILIKIFSVEYYHQDRIKTQRNDSIILKEFMKLKGYRVLTTVNNAYGLANDLIFAHKSVKVKVTEEIKPKQTRRGQTKND